MNSPLFDDAMQRANSRQMDIGDLLQTAEALKAQKLPETHRMLTDLYKTWIAMNGDHPHLHAIYFNYGVCLSDAGDTAGAINALREVIRIKPEFCPSHINLGGILERTGQVDKAISTWNAMVESFSGVNADSVNYKLLGLKQLGRVLESLNSDTTAEDMLKQSLEINHDQSDVMQHYISLRQRQCKWPSLTDTDRISKKKLAGAISALSVACYTDDPLFHLAISHNYNRKTIGLPKVKFEKLKPVQGAHGKLRIGYVSSDLRHHAVGFAMTDVFDCHDRHKFEIFAYYCGIKTSDYTMDRIKKSVDHWIDINGMDDVTAAQKIRDDKIDILIDLNGYTKDARTKVFAMKPAPINANWFGFPNSMGSPYHHYIIADDYVIPESHEMYYTEKVMRLPCYQPNDRKRTVAEKGQTRAEAGLPEGVVVFCCLNGMQKITNLTFQRWMKILHGTPGSVLWLLTGTADTNKRLVDLAAQQGIAADRIIFAQKMGNPEHLARYPLADLFLDTFPYGAHTTASDSMWMGVPIVTLPGRSFASRVCADLVKAAGLPELIASTPEEYVDMAISLGNDHAKLKELKEKLLKSRSSSLLFDTPKLVSHLEKLYTQMYEEYKRGELPVPDLRNLDIYLEIGVEQDLENIELVSDEDYLEIYRQRLADINDHFPVGPDSRLMQEEQPVTKKSVKRAAH